MKLINTNRFYLRGTSDQFLHLATVQNGFDEYICFVDNVTQKCYIEQVDVHGLHFIPDDNLVEQIKQLLEEYHVIDIRYGLALPD